MEHTKTPWKTDAHLHIVCGETSPMGYQSGCYLGKIFDDCIGKKTQARANAEFIVRACNCHDELAEALDIALLAMTHDPLNPDDVEFVKKALKKAKGL